MLAVCCAWIAATGAWAQLYDNYKPDNKKVVLDETNLPIVFIEVDGQMIDRYERITARMKIIHNGAEQLNYADTLAHPDQHVDYEGYVALRYRGNSSFNNSKKKPYSFHTLGRPLEEGGVKQKTKILGMSKDNKWALLAPYSDKSLMRDMLAFELARPWMEYVPDGRFCELVLDGTYYGVYVLTEVVSKGKKRLNLPDPGETGDSLTGGYLMEVDRDEGINYTSKYHPVTNSGQSISWLYVHYQYKWPDYEDLANKQVAYIKKAIDKMEKSFSSLSYKNPETGYRKYIDVRSFIDYQLATEFGHNVDGYRLSSKFYKRTDSIDSRFKLTLWDMNLAYGNADYYEGWRTDTWIYRNNNNLYYAGDPQLPPFWWYKLNQDANYLDEVKERWAQYRNANFRSDRLEATIDSMVTLLNVNGAQQRNSQAWQLWGKYVWPNKYVAPDYESEIAYLKDWVEKRIAWMDKQLGYDPAAIAVVADASPNRRVVGYYTLDGQAIASPKRGIYIVRYSDGTARKMAF